MATTAQEIFESAITLMDELNDRGVADTADSKEYKNRALAVLNVLRGEFDGGDEGESVVVPKIEDFDTPVSLSDYICQTVLPYGLAAHLIMQEDTASANFFQQRYEELKRRCKFARESEIEDVYGGVNPYNEFGYW